MPLWRAPIYPGVVDSISKLLKMKDYDVHLIMERGFQTAEARNKLVVSGLSSEADYLFFMDSDSVVSPEDLDRLVKAKKDVISGIYFMRGMPYNPVIYESDWKGKGYVFLKDVKDGIERIDGCGMGCCLIRRKVFEKVRKPWFEFNHMGNGSTEDFDFCRKLDREGFKIFAHWGVKIGHIGSYTYSYGDWKRMQDNQKRFKDGIRKVDIDEKNNKNGNKKKDS